MLVKCLSFEVTYGGNKLFLNEAYILSIHHKK